MDEAEWDVIIVGGGAAGLFAAGTAAARGRRTLVLEKNNKAGVKILMSGGTRCNITHNADTRTIADAFGSQGRALLSPLSRLSPKDVVSVFEAEGVATKIEETGKIFPVSNRAIDVRDALVRRLERVGAKMRTGCAVLGVHTDSSGGFELATAQESYRCRSLLITTGGLSYSGCGTTGDGYPWLRKMGHTITSLRPALTPITSPAPWVHSLQGITLDDAAVFAVETGSPLKGKHAQRHSYRGGLLWTHFGLSGPTAMNVSRWLSALEDYQHAHVLVDLMPDWPDARCQQWFEEQVARHGSRGIGNCLSELFQKRVVATLVEQIGVAATTRSAEVSGKARQSLLERIKRWRVPVDGTRGYPKAEVTAGGVALNEVDFQTMQSRRVPGLFLAGEILDLDGPIGGYNFQSAWSTGHTAGLYV